MNYSKKKYKIFNYDHFKRICDFSLASAIFLIGFPFFILISIVIIISSKGNPIFIQKRTGYKGNEFNIYKFRSMHIDTKRKSAQVFIDNREIFTFGRILRRYKIDELLQVINIIRGEMSFIGPRPHETNIYKAMPNWAKKRFNTKPGISGLAQVRGGIHINWEQRWSYDIEYVDIKSFIVDLRIMINTFIIIIFGGG